MKVEIINIGDELLIGQVVNTNASWMADQLNQVGIEVVQITAISDTYEHIFQGLDLAKSRADVIILTGGLGPTKDDITKTVLCNYFNTKLVFNEKVFKQVEELFHLRGFKVTTINRKQAEIPANCIPLQNINGTAPGMWFEQDGKIIISIPGVPFEMRALIKDQIIPQLLEKSDPAVIINKTVLTQGIGESALAEIITDWESNLPDYFKLAYLPQPGIVRLRLTARGNERNLLQKNLDEQLTELLKIIPNLIFGYNNDTLEQVLQELLLKEKKTLSIAESCTGGYIAQLITSVSGSSNYFMGSVVAYDNEVKEHILGLSKDLMMEGGTVSRQVVEQMALKAQSLFNTDYAIATSGIAGPNGGSKEKPVGTTWVAIATPDQGVVSKKYLFGEHRGRNIRKAALTAMNKLRLEIEKNSSKGLSV
ncbi:MAG: competence/damage-inducible protein A [Bacteroidetes bacterium]|nr:competence/damage-inducible protein A [Bacteroidota bacterium]